MPNGEKTQKNRPGNYSRMEMEIHEILVSKEPIVATFTEMLLSLAEAAPTTLHAYQYPYLFQLLGLLNTMQVVQHQMERMVQDA